MEKTEQFTSRWGLLLASLGMAVGAGNIWRFPRVVSEHGGGAFMIAWLIALFCWSIPLLMVEFYWGKQSRLGPTGAFLRMTGKKWTWAGGFVAFCCIAIMFYYAVVAGWCLYYFVQSVFFGMDPNGVEQRWESFAGSGTSVVYLAIGLATSVGVVLKGVKKGIERACKILVPVLFLLLIVAAVRALMLPGAQIGLAHLFRPDFGCLLSYRVWLEAFSQSAWSTGAGWGLMLVYAGYTRSKEDVVLNSFITGLGNNTASLLAAIAIIPTIFALLPEKTALELSGSGNEGLAFIWIPKLFLRDNTLTGSMMVIVFFAGLAMAALSSLIAMVELGVKTLMDLGLRRTMSGVILGLVGFVAAFPSAINMNVFKNQDWVWGLGLLVSGAFFSAGAIYHGVGRLRRRINATTDGWKLGGWFDIMIVCVIPFGIIAMLVWWFYQAAMWDPQGWLSPFGINSVGTCLMQWGIVIASLVCANRWLVGRIQKNHSHRDISS